MAEASIASSEGFPRSDTPSSFGAHYPLFEFPVRCCSGVRPTIDSSRAAETITRLADYSENLPTFSKCIVSLRSESIEAILLLVQLGFLLFQEGANGHGKSHFGFCVHF